MSVIIDQFEVILDSQQSGSDAAQSSAPAESASNASSLKPQDIIAVKQQYEERCERVRAH